MTQNTMTRLAMPAIISCMGLAITQAWYVKSGAGFSKPGTIGKPLAILAAQNDKIERRPTTRLIWESLTTGENLYGGEAVRTGSSASGKITFLQSGMTIGLEPDSLVIIEESDGKLQLNLVNGGVFVKSETSNAAKTSQPVLKAGDKKIELAGKSSELNLSVGSTGAAEIQVTKGDAKVAGGSGPSEIVKEGSAKSLGSQGSTTNLEISGPKSGASIPLSGLGDKINISWGKAPDGAVMFLETGLTRDSLARSQTGVPATVGHLDLPVKSGDFFWRLVAVKDGKVISAGPTTYNQGVALEPPKLLNNSENEKIIAPKTSGPLTVKLAWTRPHGADEVTVVLSKDPTFQNIAQSKSFSTETEWDAPVQEPGKYYWKTFVKWPGIDRKIPSQPGSFEIATQKEIPAPVLITPGNDSILLRQKVEATGILLSWSAIEGVDSYELTIQKKQADQTYKSILTKQINSPQFRITNVPAGDFQWSVSSRAGGVLSRPSAMSRFSIKELPLMLLANGTSKDEVTFESPSHFVTLAFKDLPTAAAHLRYTVKSGEGGAASAPATESATHSQLKIKLPSAGIYIISVETLDSKQGVVAMNHHIEIEAKVPDLLPPPQLVTNPKSLKTGESGDINLKWSPVKGAFKYIVEITGPKTNFRKEISATQINMNNLLPGTHTLILTAVDKMGRSGTKSQGISIEVPNVSGIAAPGFKGIRVK